MKHLILAGHGQTHPAHQLCLIFCLIRQVTGFNADVFHFYVVDLTFGEGLIKFFVRDDILGQSSRMPVQAQSQGPVD